MNETIKKLENDFEVQSLEILEQKESILADSYWQNLAWFKEICRSKSFKRLKQAKAVEKIRNEWIEVQQQIILLKKQTQ